MSGGEPDQTESRPRRRSWTGWFRRPGRSLTRRLILLAAGWIVIALVLTGWVLTTQFKESALRRLGATLNETIDQVVLNTSATPQGVVVQPVHEQRTESIYSGKYWAVAELTPEGRVRFLARSRSLWDTDMPVPVDLPPRLTAAIGETISYNAAGPKPGEPLRVAATMKQLPGRQTPVAFLAGVDRSAVDADTRQFATVTWLALLLLGAGLVTAVLLQVQIGLRPLYALRNEIAGVRKGRKARIERDYPVEIQPLAEQVNRLLDHNQEVVDRQRTHVGNLAHALKTPISVMLSEAGQAEGVLPDMVRKQTGVMQAQVDHHLRRARAAARAAHGLGERTPVAEVIEELAVMIEQVFRAKDLEIDWRAPDGLGFLGERQDLQEILGNLIENAGKWSKRRVRVSAGSSGLGMLIAVVEDDGPGLPPDQRETVLKRGARLDESAPGSGLGLSIVDELVRAYGGRLTLGESDLGGLKAMLELPAAEA